ncbi:MAG: SRPBCC family protein [Deferribacteres bacterium]|nr:SRPBCC family protein [candidate division KSB1 bacterium]MCB9504238.1 SRPBCC family protein [Deferribacteres bacterium]
MNALKKIIYVIIAIIVLFFVVGIFLPADYTLEREVTIEKPVDVVFSQVANFENRVKWSPWAAMDPDAKNSFEGTPGEVGSKWIWEGDPQKIGMGSLEIVELNLNENLKTKLEFVSPRAGIANGGFTFEAVEGGTKATWHFNQKLSYPVERYLGVLLLDKMLAPSFESGLQRLKAQCEALPEAEDDGDGEEDSTSLEEGGA